MGLDIIYITSFNGFRARMCLARLVLGMSAMMVRIGRSHSDFSFLINSKPVRCSDACGL